MRMRWRRTTDRGNENRKEARHDVTAKEARNRKKKMKSRINNTQSEEGDKRTEASECALTSFQFHSPRESCAGSVDRNLLNSFRDYVAAMFSAQRSLLHAELDFCQLGRETDIMKALCWQVTRRRHTAGSLQEASIFFQSAGMSAVAPFSTAVFHVMRDHRTLNLHKSQVLRHPFRRDSLHPARSESGRYEDGYGCENTSESSAVVSVYFSSQHQFESTSRVVSCPYSNVPVHQDLVFRVHTTMYSISLLAM